jgi:hypothetical protein
MRKTIFLGFVAVGAAAGLIVALNADWTLRLVMMAIGTVVGLAIGGAVTGVGRRPKMPEHSGVDESYGQGTSADDRDRNFWRDRGHPPFMKPPSAEPDRHMFDPDRLS